MCCELRRWHAPQYGAYRRPFRESPNRECRPRHRGPIRRSMRSCLSVVAVQSSSASAESQQSLAPLFTEVLDGTARFGERGGPGFEAEVCPAPIQRCRVGRHHASGRQVALHCQPRGTSEQIVASVVCRGGALSFDDGLDSNCGSTRQDRVCFQ